MTSVDSNFNFQCGRPHGAGPPFPVHMRPPEPDPLPPPCGRHKWMAPYAKCRLQRRAGGREGLYEEKLDADIYEYACVGRSYKCDCILAL